MQSSIWKKLFFHLLATAVCLAAVVQTCYAQNRLSDSPQVIQNILVDSTRTLAFEEVLNAKFTPLNTSIKQPFSNSVIWLRLYADHDESATESHYLKILPAFLSELTLYRPSKKGTEPWEVQTFNASALTNPIPLGAIGLNDSIYLRLISPIDFRLIAVVDSKPKLDFVQKRITIFVIMVTTMMLLFAIISIFRLIRKVNGVSLGLVFLSTSVPLCWISAMGLWPFMFDIDQLVAPEIFTKALILSLIFISSIWILIAAQLFQSGKLIKYLWILVLLIGLVFIGSFFDRTLALDVLEILLACIKWTCFVFLCLQAFYARQHLKLRSEKMIFFILFLFLLTPFTNAPNWMNPLVSSLSASDSPYFSGIIFLRALIPIGAFILTTWSYDRLRQDRISLLKTQLKNSNDDLVRESTRLEQQKKFTAMLTHELKNPLMASQMALSSIENRLEADDPSLLRVNAIRQSLLEIDAVIERCSEIDKYEQGFIPLDVRIFRLDDLVTSVKASLSSERIYIIARGVPEYFELRSDIYYLKAILINLLTNALKYSVSESLVEMTIEHAMDQGRPALVFTVSNEVIAEGAPDRNRVFERYYRSEMAKQQSGAGLGLWLAQSMAHALGSRIHLITEDHLVKFQFSIAL